jgi:hypothetical protein
MVVSTTEQDPLPLGTEARLADFTELLATAIENAESREALARLAEEQAMLRRMATLVAQGVRPDEVFSAVSEEVGRIFGSDTAAVVRFEHDPPALVVVGARQSIPASPIGTRWELDDGLASTEVYRTGRSARVDAMDWSSLSGPVAESARRLGVVSSVACPIIVEGRLWGTLSVSPRRRCRSMPRNAWRSSPSWSQPRSPMRTAAPSLPPRAGGSSPRRTRRAAGSSETSTTAPSSDWSRSDWQCAPRRPMSLPTGRPSRRAVPHRHGTGRCGRGAAGALAWDPPRDPFPGWSRPGVANARAPLSGPGRARHHGGHAAP